MGKKALTDMLEVEGGPGKCISVSMFIDQRPKNIGQVDKIF